MDCVAVARSFRVLNLSPSSPNNYASLARAAFPILKAKSCFWACSTQKSTKPNNFSVTSCPYFPTSSETQNRIPCLRAPNDRDVRNPDSKRVPISPSLQTVGGFAVSETQKLVSPLKRAGDSERVFEDGCGDFSQNGAFGVALLSATSTAKVRISPFLAALAANPTFVSGMLAWMVSQSIKVVLKFLVERRWDFRILCASGGMPSSHSALCMALTTSVALCHGFADSLFPVSLGFSLIVMYDAIGVRRHAGMQAKVLNMILEDLFQGHPISQRKLKELLGHTPSQVLAGAVLGIIVSYVCCRGGLAVP